MKHNISFSRDKEEKERERERVIESASDMSEREIYFDYKIVENICN